jgi:predicted permease
MLSRAMSLWRNLFHKQHVELDLAEELRSLLQLLTDEKMRLGMSAEQALRESHIEVGGLAQVAEKVRAARAGATLETIGKDLRYAARILARRPLFTTVAILTLAIGIGANTAIFSVVNAVLLQPLPYPASDRLAIIWSVLGNEGRAPASGSELVSLQERSRLFEQFAGIWVQSGALTGKGEPEQIKLGLVTHNFLTLLCSRPQLGRLFLAEEQGAGRAPAVIISDGLWRRRYGADAQIVGQSVILNGQSRTVVGIMPPGFKVAFPEGSSVPPDLEAFIPFPNDLASDPRDPSEGYIRVIGLLRKDATFPQAQAEADSIAAQLRSEFSEYSEQSLNLRVAPLQGDVVRNLRPALLALFGGVGLILLIACVNVANLLLSRANERRKEVTLRIALGAAPSRIMRQLLTESILLACLGGAAALVVGWWALQWLLAMRPEGLMRTNTIDLNLTVLAFTIAVSLGAGILFGLAPAWQAAKVDLLEALKEGGRGTTSDRQRFRSLLVLCEVALGFILLIGAGLMMRTFAEMLRVNPGFDPTHVLTFQVSLPQVRYPKGEQAVSFARELQRRLASLPGVQAAGVTSHLPFDDDLPNWYSYYWPDGVPRQEQNILMADHRSVLPGFFPSLGVTFVAGRNFDASDEVSNRKVVIIDDALARQAWPNQDPIGKKLNLENGLFVRDVAEVVGVVKHLQYHSLTDQVRPQLFLPYSFAARRNISFSLRTTGDPQTYVDQVGQEVFKLDKDLPVYHVRLLENYVLKARTETRFVTTLSGVLAGIGLLLAGIGIYGVTANSVLRRTNDIAIRMALGAQRREVLGLVLRQGMLPVIWGEVIGLALSLVLAPLLSSLLFGVRPADPGTIVATSIFISVSGLLACALPAWRATRANPMTVLRYE